jgi:hypothetical protein
MADAQPGSTPSLTSNIDPFYVYVAGGALVLLIIVLIILGILMKELQSTDPFPPIQNACPDYWDVSSNPAYCVFQPSTAGNRNTGLLTTYGSGTNQQLDPVTDKTIAALGVIDTNNGKLYTKGGSTANAQNVAPSTSTSYTNIKLNNNDAAWTTLYPGSSVRCAQQQWAQYYNIVWDGVSNYSGC